MRGASSLSSPRFGAILHFQVAELLFSSVSTSTSQAKSNKQTRPPLSFFADLRERERERNRGGENKRKRERERNESKRASATDAKRH